MTCRAALLLVALLWPGAAGAEQFARKECADCHQKFDERIGALKNVHPAVKQQKCEDCHLRHGIVPKSLLKQSGNALCLTCHEKKSIGLDKPNVHPVLKTGECTKCHDPHGSNARFMLKAEGASACATCHDRAPFEKKIVHQPLKDGCRTCHLAHASDQKSLLTAAPEKLCLSCHKSPVKAHGGIAV